MTSNGCFVACAHCTDVDEREKENGEVEYDKRKHM